MARTTMARTTMALTTMARTTMARTTPASDHTRPGSGPDDTGLDDIGPNVPPGGGAPGPRPGPGWEPWFGRVRLPVLGVRRQLRSPR